MGKDRHDKGERHHDQTEPPVRSSNLNTMERPRGKTNTNTKMAFVFSRAGPLRELRKGSRQLGAVVQVST